MSELVDFLMTQYYAKYKGNRTDIVPTPEQLERGYLACQDKFIIVRDEKIKGVAIFVTLSDETYRQLNSIDVTSVDVLKRLLMEHGPNVHFVLLCAGGVQTIMYGLAEVKRRLNPKTISWWNPNLNKLHQYTLRK